MLDNFFAMFRDEEGQGLVEYALIIVMVAIAVIALLQAVGVEITGVFTRINTALNTAPGG